MKYTKPKLTSFGDKNGDSKWNTAVGACFLTGSSPSSFCFSGLGEPEGQCSIGSAGGTVNCGAGGAVGLIGCQDGIDGIQQGGG